MDLRFTHGGPLCLLSVEAYHWAAVGVSIQAFLAYGNATVQSFSGFTGTFHGPKQPNWTKMTDTKMHFLGITMSSK